MLESEKPDFHKLTSVSLKPQILKALTKRKFRGDYEASMKIASIMM